MQGIRKINPAEWQRSPWRNGGGTTIQLAIFPEGLTVSDPFVWRLALAETDRSGPYSPFAGYTRALIPLAKSNIALRHGQAMEFKPLAPFKPYIFSGDDLTESKIEKSAIDLNTIVKRDWGSQQVSALELEVTQSYEFNSSRSSFSFIFCAEGAFTFTQSKTKNGLRVNETLCFQKTQTLEPIIFNLTSPHVMGRLIVIEFFQNG